MQIIFIDPRRVPCQRDDIARFQRVSLERPTAASKEAGTIRFRDPLFDASRRIPHVKEDENMGIDELIVRHDTRHHHFHVYIVVSRETMVPVSRTREGQEPSQNDD